MTDIGELVAVALIKDIDAECPFTLTDPKKPKIEKEHAPKDDTPGAARIQVNNGGTLGKNLTNASNGAADTVNDLFPADKPSKDPPKDTKRNDGGMVNVSGDDKPRKFTLAAHHLIPGEASLTKSKLFEQYMVEGGKPDARGGTQYTIKANIGYNVNGAHNGVWLPGNYAIRKRTSPVKGKSWGDLIEDPAHHDWCYRYMCACVDKTSSQFHDVHPTYSEKVLKILNEMQRALVDHQNACKPCATKTEIAPPYTLKTKLYLLSTNLKLRLLKQAGERWKIPWYTSERFRELMIKNKMLFLK